jgi:hypothetical protein
VRHPPLASSPAFAQRHVAAERVAALLAAVPAAWVAAARAAAAAAAPPQPPSPAHVLHTLLLPRLAWRLPVGQAVSFARLTVRSATALLAAPAAEQRASLRLAPFASLATAGSPPSPSHLPELQAAMRRPWHLPWENGLKEVFWRLACDALPTAARLHRDQPCDCGAGPRPDRHHHFWACPAAHAVVAAVQAALAAAAPTPAEQPAPLLPANIWLARTPPGLDAGVGGWSAWRLSRPWTVAGVLWRRRRCGAGASSSNSSSSSPASSSARLTASCGSPSLLSPLARRLRPPPARSPPRPRASRRRPRRRCLSPPQAPPRRLPLGGQCVLVPPC